MFSQDESLNVDLTKLLPLNAKSKREAVDNSKKYDKFVYDAKLRNNWKYFLQKSLMNVAGDLLQSDLERTDLVNEHELLKIINKRTSVPENIKHIGNNELNNYINEFKGEGNKVNYRDMIQDLQKFDYM